MKYHIRAKSLILGLFLAIIAFCPFNSPAMADLVWQTDASGDLTGTRTSTPGDGVVATDGWADGAFELSWNVTNRGDGTWEYQYTVNVDRKDPSHFILEVTEDSTRPVSIIYPGSDTEILGPQNWSKDDGSNDSNPLMPNDIFGVKFDFEGEATTIYTIVTDRAPVWGVFYIKDGKDKGVDVVAYSTALASDYKYDATLTTADFIVRPDAYAVPIQGAVWLLGSGLLGLAAIQRKKQH